MTNYDDGLCHICMEPHTEKTMLDCGHVFCFDCLKTWCKYCKSKVRCPTCNHPFQLEDIVHPNLSFFGDWKRLLHLLFSFFLSSFLSNLSSLMQFIFGCISCVQLFRHLDNFTETQEWLLYLLLTFCYLGIFVSFWFILRELRDELRQLRDRGVVCFVYHRWVLFCFNYELSIDYNST